jgi:pyridoxine/pyridoxamine 5'-phosphate oxidase
LQQEHRSQSPSVLLALVEQGQAAAITQTAATQYFHQSLQSAVVAAAAEQTECAQTSVDQAAAVLTIHQAEQGQQELEPQDKVKMAVQVQALKIWAAQAVAVQPL